MKINKALKALSEGLLDGGYGYVTCFPGFHSQDVFSLLGGKDIAINEKMAYEMAFGGSLAGVRSVVTFKSFGLNVAADPFLNSMVSGVNAGLVVILTEDVEVAGSQCRQDSRSYRDFFGGLWFEPNSLQETYDVCYNSFTWSERLDIPIVIRLTNQFFKLEEDYARKPEQKKIRLPIADSHVKFVVHPTNSITQRENLTRKKVKIKNFIKDFYLGKQVVSPTNHNDPEKGCIVFGNCQNELMHYSGHDVLPITTYPIPVNLVRNFMKARPDITVLEQGNGYGFNLVKKVTSDNQNVQRSNTGIIPDHRSRYITWSRLEKMFLALKSVEPDFIVGDLGQYTSENTKSIQACLCLGASIPIGIGLYEAGIRYPFCVSGDASLTHAGLSVISEVIARKANMGIIIIDNGGSQSTGGQMSPGGLDLLNYFNSIYGLQMMEVEYFGFSREAFANLFKNMKQQNKTAVVRVKVK